MAATLVIVHVFVWRIVLATASKPMSCGQVRTDTGYGSHRTLHMPAAMWDAAGEVERMWAAKLCCIFTWVVRDTSAASPFLITYDGGKRTYGNSASFSSAADCVYSNVCSMSMGSSDCATAAQRCPAASISTHPTAMSTTTLALAQTTLADPSSDAVSVREYQAVGMLCRPKNADGYSISTKVASAAACRAKCEADKEKCGAFEYEYVAGDDRECELHEKTKVNPRETQAMGSCLLHTEGGGDAMLDAPVLGEYRCCWILKELANCTASVAPATSVSSTVAADTSDNFVKTSAISANARCAYSATPASITLGTQSAIVLFVMALV